MDGRIAHVSVGSSDDIAGPANPFHPPRVCGPVVRLHTLNSPRL